MLTSGTAEAIEWEKSTTHTGTGAASRLGCLMSALLPATPGPFSTQSVFAGQFRQSLSILSIEVEGNGCDCQTYTRTSSHPGRGHPAPG